MHAKELFSNNQLKYQDNTLFFYQVAKMLGVSMHHLGKILDAPIEHIKKNTVWEIQAKKQGDVCRYDIAIPKPARTYGNSDWRMSLAKFLTEAAMDQDPHGAGFVGAIHLFLKEHADKDFEIKITVKFLPKLGADLQLTIDLL